MTQSLSPTVEQLKPNKLFHVPGDVWRVYYVVMEVRARQALGVWQQVAAYVLGRCCDEAFHNFRRTRRHLFEFRFPVRIKEMPEDTWPGVMFEPELTAAFKELDAGE